MLKKKIDLLGGLILFMTIFMLLVNGTVVEAHSEIKEIRPRMSEILDFSPVHISVMFAKPVEVYSESLLEGSHIVEIIGGV